MTVVLSQPAFGREEKELTAETLDFPRPQHRPNRCQEKLICGSDASMARFYRPNWLVDVNEEPFDISIVGPIGEGCGDAILPDLGDIFCSIGFIPHCVDIAA